MGTYHTRPLLEAAVAGGVRLSQWCPSFAHIKPGDPVHVVVGRDAFAGADVVVVNGCASQHTVDAVGLAQEFAVALAYTELAVGGFRPAEVQVDWASVTCCSHATRPLLARMAGCETERVIVTGSPSLDGLPAWQPRERTVLGVTSVSAPTETGNHREFPHGVLYDALVALEQRGFRVVVCPHPRENVARWKRWPIDRRPSPAQALSEASLVVGIPGTIAITAATIGVPFLGLADDGVLDYLWSLMTRVSSVEDVLAAATAQPGPETPSAETVEAVCGPHRGAAGRIISAWKQGLEARRASQARPDAGSATTSVVND